ncbi:hypothetical protein HanXRQr2_Chr03g0099921 [Helianthus annuus]|uniref:Uncharacterized protein n=1 Tax=Helianthus annuus TaxID=4232 RepID=A0A9K3JF93_HELAN|nr:hypothetical protein HanXRQr2_Chr03g0099921 [Helianthus annuus]KAJ0942778.1 hypothetical protein HanPSC8_Chr03g0096191 [Helianthus annuus]
MSRYLVSSRQVINHLEMFEVLNNGHVIRHFQVFSVVHPNKKL